MIILYALEGGQLTPEYPKYEFYVSDLMLYKYKIDFESVKDIFHVYRLSGEAMKMVSDFYSNYSSSVDFLDVMSCYYASTTSSIVLTNEVPVKSIADSFEVDCMTIKYLQDKLLIQNTG
ncbi:hypothetical protein [Draconibacterium orientale]|uniref:hypothetical protein n=1 Tax=Draconibacterium orientale TaxID=1168034 RepID=UPI0029C0DFA0|nr:hypothetical protein [Draconibacterium orientale]